MRNIISSFQYKLNDYASKIGISYQDGHNCCLISWQLKYFKTKSLPRGVCRYRRFLVRHKFQGIIKSIGCLFILSIFRICGCSCLQFPAFSPNYAKTLIILREKEGCRPVFFIFWKLKGLKSQTIQWLISFIYFLAGAILIGTHKYIYWTWTHSTRLRATNRLI